MSTQDDETLDETLDEPVSGLSPGIMVQSFVESDFEIGAVTHCGSVRANNEDQYLILRRTRSSEVLACSLDDESYVADRDHAWLMVVADGLGGQVSGQVASATAIRAVVRFAGELSSWIMRPLGELREDMQERVALYCDAINREMQAQVEANPSLAGMATTMTAAYVFARQAFITHVGDSRSYLIRNEQLTQITNDHTLAQQLREQGLPHEVTHAYRNLLTRCIDTSGRPARFDLFHIDLQPGDRLLLCSDGLSDMVSDSELLQVIRMAETTAEACRMLTATALRKGGRDNITLVMAQLKGSDQESDEAEDAAMTLDSTFSTIL